MYSEQVWLETKTCDLDDTIQLGNELYFYCSNDTEKATVNINEQN